jgi:lipoprotein NlpI
MPLSIHSATLLTALLTATCGPVTPITLAQTSPAQQPPTATADVPAKIQTLNQDLEAQFREQLKLLPTPSPDTPPGEAIDRHSQRGDLQMFLAQFPEAETSYRRMVELDPAIDASHWRLGIACFFAKHPQAGADQFEKYHSFDSVDRENGIWRYFCHHRASGKEKAQKQLIRYETDDRPPFREVYQLFQGTLTPEQVLKAASDAPEAGRQSRLFYSHLYVGLNAALENQRDVAIHSLQQATLNQWPQSAGYGPRYMWHIGRLQLNLLAATPETPPK